VKAKARSTLARLEALEAVERERVAAVEAVKEEQSERAFERLAPAELAALYAWDEAQEAGGTWWAAVVAAGQAVGSDPLEDPAGEAARAWGEAFADTPDGTPWPVASVGAAAYFEREAVRCDLTGAAALAGGPLPPGVALEALEVAARWSAALLRLQAAHAAQLSEAVKV